MSRIKVVCLITCIVFGLVALFGVVNQQVAMAKSREAISLGVVLLEQAAPPEEGAPEGKIEFETQYPVLSGPADTSFEFDVKLTYVGGEEARDFELSIESPQGWMAYIGESSYNKDKQISSIRLEPGVTSTVAVMAMAPFWLYPEPGEYTITVEAASEKIKGSFDITSKITARYDFSAATKLEGGRLNIKAQSGKESYLPIEVTNTGTAALNKVTFSSTKPEGWSVTFDPEKIESLSPGDSQEVEVTIKPPAKTIAGDYMITFKFAGDPSSHANDLGIRVAVGTSTRWGLIGVAIVVAIIAGLAVAFTRFGRR